MSERNDGAGGDIPENVDQRVIDCNNKFNTIVDRFNTLLDLTRDLGVSCEIHPPDEKAESFFSEFWVVQDQVRVNLPPDNPFYTSDNPVVDHVRVFRTALYPSQDAVFEDFPTDTKIRILVPKPDFESSYTSVAKIEDVRSDGKDRLGLLEREKHLAGLSAHEAELNSVQQAFFDDQLNPALALKLDRAFASEAEES